MIAPPPVEDLSRLHRVLLTIEAELDRATMPFDDVAALREGSLVRLRASAGETIALSIGGVRIGSGEVLLVDGMLTVRVAELEGLSTQLERGEE